MDYPREYINYLVHFHGDRDFFECHEILEEYWKSQTQRSDTWVALIQVAVGLYHHRRGNLLGAQKMLDSSLKRMKRNDCLRLGLDYDRLSQLLKERLASIAQGEEYIDVNLPITDSNLLDLCLIECKNRGFTWQATSGTEEELIHRHTLRDRSDVIQAREEQRLKKQMKRDKET